MPPPPRTAFDWAVYADATFAGLSMLIPVPFVDSAFEWYFSQRIPVAVARRRRRRLQPEVVGELLRAERHWIWACLLWPLAFSFSLIKRLSKKLLYFLTVKDATDRLSFYWHRAFLIDYALQQGHLDQPADARLAQWAMNQALRASDTSPLIQLANRTVAGTHHVFRSLRRARRGQEDAAIESKRSAIAQAWDSFGTYFGEVAVRYNQAYDQALAARSAAEAAVEAAAQAEASAEAAAQAEAPAVADDSPAPK